MAAVIALFNNKGGVSKTTTCFNLGWKLSERGHSVVMVDADPQCNLTGMVLDLTAGFTLEDFYKANPKRNIRDALEPAFSSRPVPLQYVNCIEVEGRENLRLVPGHVGLAEYEVSLGLAQQLSETVQALQNLPGSLRWLIDLTADHYEADIVLVDLSPGLGALNQNLVTTADYFSVPTSPDVFSVMALESLARVLPRWARWARNASELEALADADYPFKKPDLKFLGTIVQRFRLRSGTPTKAFQEYIDLLDLTVTEKFAPALADAGLLLDSAKYEEIGDDLATNYRLSNISDFNTLIAVSQQARKPVFALTQEDVRQGGKVWEVQQQSIASFSATFDELARRVEVLVA